MMNPQHREPERLAEPDLRLPLAELVHPSSRTGVGVLAAAVELVARWEAESAGEGVIAFEWTGPAIAAAPEGLTFELGAAGREPSDEQGLDGVRCQFVLRDGDVVLGRGTAVALVAGDAATEPVGVPPALEPGASVEKTYAVEPPWLTDHIGAKDVLTTPALVGFFEDAAATLAEPHLASGYGIVGTRIDIRHVAASYPGEQVSVRATLVGRTGARLAYLVDGHVGRRLIGTGRVEQRVVAVDRFGNGPDVGDDGA